jgi:hypothetical protein
MRHCESLRLNGWTYTEFDDPKQLALVPDKPKTNLYDYGVGLEPGHFIFQENILNPGMGAVLNSKTTESNPMAIQIVSLDIFARERGWFESRPNIAVFKGKNIAREGLAVAAFQALTKFSSPLLSANAVDVEGFEPAVIDGAKELLKSHLIHNILMEISTRTEKESLTNLPMLNFLAVEAGYVLHKIGGWPGPDGEVLDWPSDHELAGKINAACKLEYAKQLNLWWKKPV